MSKKISKILSISLVLILLLSFAVACGPGEVKEPQTTSTSKTEESGKKSYKAACIYNVSDPYNGGGYERMVLEGVDAVREELGWQVDVAEGVEFSKMYEVAADYASAGYDMIFFPGGEFYDAWWQLAEDYPETWGIMVSLVKDSPASGNACVVGSDKFGYGVIVGVVMSMMSETGKIGVVGGMPVGGVLTEFSGLIEGAKYARPDVEVLFGWTGEYEDVANHHAVTSQLIERGADVIFTATGPGYKGVWEAAGDAKAHVIGYGYDSYNIDPNVVSGSVVYDGKQQLLHFATELEKGTLTPGFHPFGYENVKISDFRGSIDADLEKEIRDLCQKIFDGEIVIPAVEHNFS